MTIDIKKIKNISDTLEAERRKRIEEEKERAKLSRQRKPEHPDLSNKWADEVIKKIPQIVEEAAMKGKRQAEVYSVYAYDGYSLSTWPNIFTGGYFLPCFPKHFRIIYKYCKANKLKPKILCEMKYYGEDDFTGQKYCTLHVYW
jgi:hypothetical protein